MPRRLTPLILESIYRAMRSFMTKGQAKNMTQNESRYILQLEGTIKKLTERVRKLEEDRVDTLRDLDLMGDVLRSARNANDPRNDLTILLHKD